MPSFECEVTLYSSPSRATARPVGSSQDYVIKVPGLVDYIRTTKGVSSAVRIATFRPGTMSPIRMTADFGVDDDVGPVIENVTRFSYYLKYDDSWHDLDLSKTGILDDVELRTLARIDDEEERESERKALLDRRQQW